MAKLQVRQAGSLADSLRRLEHRPVRLDADDAAALAGQLAGRVSVAAASVEHPQLGWRAREKGPAGRQDLPGEAVGQRTANGFHVVAEVVVGPVSSGGDGGAHQ